MYELFENFRQKNVFKMIKCNFSDFYVTLLTLLKITVFKDREKIKK